MCNQSSLIELDITDNFSSKPHAVAFVLTCLKQSHPSRLANLRTLQLDMIHSGGEDLASDQAMDWDALANCTALESLTLTFDSPLISDAGQAIILKSLPNSLTHLDVVTAAGQDINHLFNYMLCERLCDPLFLPYLRSVVGDDLDEPSGSLLRGLTTVMSETTKVRPFESLPLLSMNMTNQWVPFTWASRMQDISIDLSETSAALFAEQLDDVLPVLKVVNIRLLLATESANVAPLDLSDLFTFLSQRPIKDITLVLHSQSHNQQNRRCCALSPTAIQNFLRLKALRSIQIVADQVAFETNLFANSMKSESINCWPKLTEVRITGFVWGPDNITSLFRAAPKLYDMRSDLPISWSTMLPMLHYCSNLECFSDQSTFWRNKQNARRVTLHDLQAAFAAYPLSTNSFQKLHCLNIQFEILDLDALHYLCSQLSKAPLLTSFTACQLQYSNFELCIVLSKLQKLESLPEGHYVQTVLEYLDHGDERFFRSYENKRGRVETVHLTSYFRTMSDTPPRNGRKYLLYKTFTMLSDEEHVLLERWDAGEYSQTEK